MESYTTAEWEALLYDWHNDHLLRAQRADVDYWRESTADADRLLVLGAGTGRVAAPLARHRPRLVTALDLSPSRLRRVPAVPGLRPVCGDMRRLPLAGGFDTAIVPYSVMQLLVSPRDRVQALVEAARVLASGGFLHVDVSENFDTRPPKDWHVVLRAPCPAAGAVVLEWERHRPMPDHVVIERSFRLADGTVIAEARERWAHLRSLDLAAVLDRAGFDVTGVGRGYRSTGSPHRLVYHARRRG